MLLTITSTAPVATDLGFVLHKNPAHVHERDVGFGVARVVYPEASDQRCTAALIVDVDPVALVRKHGRAPEAIGFGLARYVNDRPYAASSLLSVAIGSVFRSALAGRCAERPELVGRRFPLEIGLPVAPVRGGPALLRALFEPLGYEVDAAPIALDPSVPAWGDSRYVQVRLTATLCVRDALEHLLVLLPVLDDDKHYWVGSDEVDKLLRRGGAWLADHPRRETITRRYLRHDRRLANDALARLATTEDGAGGLDVAVAGDDVSEHDIERRERLHDLRLDAVVGALEASGARRIADLGCGEGRLVQRLLREPWVDHVVGIDVSIDSLADAGRRLRLDELSPRQRARVELRQGALTYRDTRLRAFDAAVVVEVVEHLDPPRLDAFERCLFGDARPATVIVTTPNVEYNERFAGLAPGRLRHRDHRFEWNRADFTAWSERIAATYGYTVAVTPVGPVDTVVGPPTQMAVFRRNRTAATARDAASGGVAR